MKEIVTNSPHYWTIDRLTRARAAGIYGCYPYGSCWQTVAGTTMARCDHCGSHVSERFARVFADASGRILACPSCSANAGIAEASRQRTPNA